MSSGRWLALLLGVVLVAAVAAVVLTRGSSGPTSDAPRTEASPEPSATGPARRRRAEQPARVGSPEPTPERRRLARLRRIQSGIDWRRSRAEGTVNAGRLVDGVKLPPEGVHFLTWDPVEWRKPNRPWRRHGTDRLIRTILEVAREHRRAHPKAPRVTVGDISRPEGGSFDARFGAPLEFGRDRGELGHVSHQSGLDVDVYYPRRDRRERAPDSLADIDLALAQDLVDRFVAAGAEFVFVGPRTPLDGPPEVVQPLDRHDDHLHVRLPAL